MTASATITFSQPGLQSPVFVVTSLSSPPWELLEMAAAKPEHDTADAVFTRHFSNVQEGPHQYKVRIGDNYWVVDESKETATDEHGNRNNLVRAEPVVKTDESTSDTDSVINTETRPDKSQQQALEALLDERQDSPVDSRQVDQTTAETVPLIVLDEVADKQQLEYGDVEPAHLPASATKHASDTEPGVITSNTNSSPEPAFHKSAETSRIVLKELDDSPIQDRDSANNASFSHATKTSSKRSSQVTDEPDHAPLLAHERKIADDPLFSHESHAVDQHEVDAQNNDEFDRAPLLPHETGFSDERVSEVSISDQSIESGTGAVSRRPTSQKDDDDDEQDDGSLGSELDNPPLLPHERESAVDISVASDYSDEGNYMTNGRSTFKIETDEAKALFGESGRPHLFETRSHSSTLPHNLPQSDADDDNLNDPSLEQFPTGRQQILDRVATIGLHLPEDHADEDHLHSPQLSILSQACSSVDLMPVKSYVSLASVPEADDTEDDDENESNGLSSPMLPSAVHTRPDVAHGIHTPPMLDQAVQPEVSEARDQRHGPRAVAFSEAESVGKMDGAKDVQVSNHSDKAIATTTNMVRPMTPPTLSESVEIPTREDSAPGTEQQLRQRHTLAKANGGPASESRDEIDTTTHSIDDGVSISKSVPSIVQHLDAQDSTAFQNDRKRASATTAVLGITAAVAAFYLFSWAP